MNVREIFETMEYGPAAESSSEAVKWLDDRDRQFGHYIDGAFTEPASGKRFATINPATETELAQIASGNDEDIDAAVAAARKAQPGWASLKGSARARYLYALARHLQKNQRLFAVLESLDNGMLNLPICAESMACPFILMPHRQLERSV